MGNTLSNPQFWYSTDPEPSNSQGITAYLSNRLLKWKLINIHINFKKKQ